jgi:hypothetical protein
MSTFVSKSGRVFHRDVVWPAPDAPRPLYEFSVDGVRMSQREFADEMRREVSDQLGLVSSAARLESEARLQ